MNDHNFELLGLAAIAGVILWMLARGSRSSSTGTPAGDGLPVSWNSPMMSVFSANPNAFAPATPQSLTVNIANGSPNLLSNQYTPMFGFVGVAQGTMWQ